MKIDGSAVRAGMVLEYEGKLWLVVKHEIRTPGNLRAFNQVELKDVKTGTKNNVRMNSGSTVERVQLDDKTFQFLFEDGDNITLMDPENYEQVTMAKSLLGDAAPFLTDGMMLTVQLYEGTPLSVTMPETVVATIAEADPVVKGQTASSSYKPAVLENGVRVMVPPFLTSGEKIVVRTADATYVERAKKAG